MSYSLGGASWHGSASAWSHDFPRSAGSDHAKQHAGAAERAAAHTGQCVQHRECYQVLNCFN